MAIVSNTNTAATTILGFRLHVGGLTNNVTLYNASGVTNGAAACTSGRCVVSSCNTGFGDCDRAASNGCEADLGFNRLHCGRCGHVCTKACVDGACTM